MSDIVVIAFPTAADVEEVGSEAAGHAEGIPDRIGMKDLKIMADAGQSLGIWSVPVPGQSGSLRRHSSLAAAPIQVEQQLRALRGDPGHLPRR